MSPSDLPEAAIAAASSPYRALAVGDYLLGRTDLATAARLAGMSEQEIVHAVRARTRQSVQADSLADRPVPALSVVIPVYNNASTLAELHTRLARALTGLGRSEVILVNDGSADSSARIIDEIAERDPTVHAIHLSRNFGQQAALTAGLDHSRGQAVVLMDADLQDPPERIEELVAQWRAGYQVVSMVRGSRQEGGAKRLAYHLFYRLYRYLAEVDVPLDSGDFCLLDRQVVATLNAMPERTRFLRGLRSWTGFRQATIRYDRPPRPSGESQYTLRRLLRLAADGLLAFSSVPLRLAALLGAVTSSAGFLLSLLVISERLADASLPTGWASGIATSLFIGGVQLLAIGVVGAYVARIYIEVKNRPVYVVARHSEPAGE